MPTIAYPTECKCGWHLPIIVVPSAGALLCPRCQTKAMFTDAHETRCKGCGWLMPVYCFVNNGALHYTCPTMGCPEKHSFEPPTETGHPGTGKAGDA